IEHIICYALKANSSLAICKVLADAGSGAEIVSGGELFRALRVAIPAEKIVFNGNGKTAEELSASLECDILMFNVDSESELNLLNRIAAEMGRKARVALRINPDIDPRTHPYISTGLRENKFGIAIEQAIEFYEQANAMANVEVVGIHNHIGSQIVELSPFVESLERLMSLMPELKRKGLHLRYIDMGGGIGITYNDERPPSFEEYVDAIRPLIEDSGCTLVVEPGRVIVGNAGIVVTRVLHVKTSGRKNFVVVDAAMNDLMRPGIYGAYHLIIPVERRHDGTATMVADVVGGICESTDFFARGRELPALKPGELIAIMSAGAYGSAMSSNYNSRPLIAEVMVDGTETVIIRRRQTFEEMVALESF
ncbi:MAG: diaminopimelate decarboxylase, partial [Candidatus Hydrogenedentota bacterium]